MCLYLNIYRTEYQKFSTARQPWVQIQEMEKTIVIILILVSASGILTQTDMSDKVFFIPKESATSYVRLNPMKNGPFASLTVCLKSYTTLTRAHSLFSLATPNKDNDFLLFQDKNNKFSVSIGNQDWYLDIPGTAVVRSICASWDSLTGDAVVWVNGNPYPRNIFMKGYKVNANPIIIIGQEQDSYGGKFDAAQSLVGEISDVHMWDRVLTSQELKLVLYNRGMVGDVINWQNLNYETKGEVIILPQVCKIHYYPDSCYNPTEEHVYV
uniref:Pentraxin (PTX) domain-containing protein n=2 Tax=Xenopus tropicalis TaxID=8364 RepID=A0A6I8RDP3_XENTR